MHWLRRRELGKVLVLSTLCWGTVWSCSSSDAESIKAAGLAEGCTLNSDCRNPLTCTFTRCHDQCKTDRDCPGEQRCVRGTEGYVCQLKVETDCSKNPRVCQGAAVCGVDGECRDACAKDADCTVDQVCATNGQCASRIPTKDLVDGSGNILADPFVDPDLAVVGSSGSGGGAAAAGGWNGSGAGTTGAYALGGGAAGSPLNYAGASVSVSGADTAGIASTVASGGMTVPSAAGSPSASGGGAIGTGASGAVPVAGASPAGGPTIAAGSGNLGYAGNAGLAACSRGWGDCDSNPNDCETSLALITSCGACNVACDPSHGAVKCDAASLKCVINTDAGGCNKGYSDCNKDGKDGCEAYLATDLNNCGACGRGCGGGNCSNGQCGATIVFDPTGASSLSYYHSGSAFLVGGTLVKLNNDNGTEIRSVTLPPTTPASQGAILATSTTAIYSMDVDSTNVYYSIGGSPASILYKALNGTSSTAAKSAVNMPDSNYAQLLTSNTTAFYMVAYASGGYQILTAAKTLTSATTASPLSGVTARSAISSLVVAGTSVFWTESPNFVYTAPIGGGTPIVLDSTSQSGYYSYLRLVTDGTYVYFNTYNGASSRIRRVPAAGSPSSAAVEDVALGVENPAAGMAVDDKYVYFYSSQQVYRAVKDGTASVESLANLNSTPYFYDLFAVDAGYVYGTGSQGQIVRVSKTLPTH